MKSFLKFPTFPVIKLSDGVLHTPSFLILVYVLCTSQLFLVNQYCSKDLASLGKRVKASLFFNSFLKHSTFRHHRHSEQGEVVGHSDLCDKPLPAQSSLVSSGGEQETPNTIITPIQQYYMKLSQAGMSQVCTTP